MALNMFVFTRCSIESSVQNWHELGSEEQGGSILNFPKIGPFVYDYDNSNCFNGLQNQVDDSDNKISISDTRSHRIIIEMKSS
jgi:hypothetical protein